MNDKVKKVVNTAFSINYIFQGIFSLVTPIGLMCLLAWLLTSKCHAPNWLWAVLIILGVFAGLYSMVKYLITVTEIEKRREKEQNKDDK